MGDPSPTTDELIETVELCVSAMRSLSEEDWDRTVDGLEWTAREVLAHVAGLRYALTFGSRSPERLQIALQVDPDAPIDAMLRTIGVMTTVFAEVARSASPDELAYHPAGHSDVTGFTAMYMDELLIHTHEITATAGLPIDPPDHLVVAVLDRLFPWWPRDERPFDALLWVNGRTPLGDRPKQGEEWMWLSTPLADWDGATIPLWDPVNERPVQR